MPVSSRIVGLQPYWVSECGRAVVYVGDCRDVMSQLEPQYFHAVVTDPPYNLAFDVGQVKGDWDFCGNGKEFQRWFEVRAEEMLRVAKPGAHLLSFGGTRMWHRMACGIEDAGWEIRDCLMWVYSCLSEDTEILTKDGWRSYTDIKKGDTVAAWDCRTEAIVLEQIEEVTVTPYTGKMIKFKNDNTDQLLTPNHRVYKKHAVRFQDQGVRIRAFEEDWNVRKAGDINRHDPIKLPLAGYHNGPGIGGTDYAELLGWVWTEGGFDSQWNGVRITQCSVNAAKIEMIYKCLTVNNIPSKHYTRERQYNHKEGTFIEHTWFISGESALKIRASLPDKHPTWELLWSMTLDEKRAFFNSAMLGDGSGTAFYQKDTNDREWFRTLLCCIGMQGRDNPKKIVVSINNTPTTELQSRHLKDWYEEYTGNVWCVTVPSKAFLARRNGKVFITGNSGYPKGRDISKDIDKLLGAEREVVGRVEMMDTTKVRPGFTGQAHAGNNVGSKRYVDLTVPATDAAKQWEGWNTTLKPAWEPIVVARKLPIGPIAQNVLANGCGGINVGACRVGENDDLWPANLLTDGADEQLRRYFYCPKSNDSDRPHGEGSTAHPTVKPLDLMRYLVRLVCARGSWVLDPFAGSFSTGCATLIEGMNFVGIEQSVEYADIGVGRMKLALQSAPPSVELGTRKMTTTALPPPTETW